MSTNMELFALGLRVGSLKKACKEIQCQIKKQSSIKLNKIRNIGTQFPTQVNGTKINGMIYSLRNASEEDGARVP